MNAQCLWRSTEILIFPCSGRSNVGFIVDVHEVIAELGFEKNHDFLFDVYDLERIVEEIASPRSS